MQNRTDYEIAQERVEARQRKRNVFAIWLTILALVVLLDLLGGSTIQGCLLPLVALVALGAAAKGVDLYHSSPARRFSPDLLAQELAWLYGEDWRNTAGTQEYALAQDRIRKRRIGRWPFFFHCLIFVAVNAYLSTLVAGLVRAGESSGLWLLVIPVLWLIVLAVRAWQAFPTAGILSRREYKAGQAIEAELRALQSHKQKHAAKRKNDARFVLSDDGELTELPDEAGGEEPQENSASCA